MNLSGPLTDGDGLCNLESLWKELHLHHLEVAAYPRLVSDLDASWGRRLDWYRRLVASGASYVTATSDHGELIGYALVTTENGPDDTFDVNEGIAEVVTLVVKRGQRSAGVGRALLAAAEQMARQRGCDVVKIAVMAGNARAQEFYEAKGYTVAEHVLYRNL